MRVCEEAYHDHQDHDHHHDHHHHDHDHYHHHHDHGHFHFIPIMIMVTMITRYAPEGKPMYQIVEELAEDNEYFIEVHLM